MAAGSPPHRCSPRPWQVAVGAVLLAVTLGVCSHASDGVDRWVTDALSGARTAPWSTLGSLLVWLGDPLVAMLAVGSLAVASPRGQSRVEAATLLAAVLGVTAAELIGKTLIAHPGPLGVGGASLGPLTWVGSLAGSFPSGHAARATCLAVAAQRRWPDTSMRCLAAGLVAAIAAALVLLRDHWSSDVVAGVALGVLLSAAAALSFRIAARSRCTPRWPAPSAPPGRAPRVRWRERC